ncbi:uncharacterized protein [Musca autumnalis]|uniref:uncharacterized protein n=1 Tax=Musca autumnalis TaxID=221902 RepID=UPI003CF7B699
MPKDGVEFVEENASSSELASLKLQRSSIKKNIANIQKKVEKDGSKMDSTILECRLEILESYFKQLCDVQSKIEAINASDNVRVELEEAFIVAKAKIMKLLKKSRGSESAEMSLMNASMACGSSSSRLPSLKLPKFDGKYSEYKRFITAFNNMVNDNPAISVIEKFNYLLNCLSGPALAVVEPFQVCEENYEKALNRLEERYDNKVLIFLEHIESLFNVPKMQKSDSVSLRHLIDTVSAVRGSLLSLGSEADVMNAILVHMVLSKLDSDTKENYDEKQDFKSLPSWDLCYELLSRRCQFLESHRKRTEVTEKVVPGEFLNTSQWKIPQNIELADPLFYKPQRIDVLLSAEVFFDLLLDGRISLGNGLPCLTNTVFGWIVGGSSPSRPNSTSLTCNLTVSTLEDQNMDDLLKRFWEVEEYSKSPATFTEEEQACEEHFLQNSRFDSDGRVVVRLPFKKSPSYLGNTFEMARRRFLSLERRLERDQTLKSMYEEFMQEYVSLGHMSLYTKSLNSSHYIIPHHCVLKPHSSTTKLRVVFDASACSSSNHSLNDILMVGPTIQQDLITTLFSFRLHKYALTADISKMYRQFRIDGQDRRFQLVLWRTNKNDELQVFQLNTVTYGLSAAPFLAIRSLFLIADKYKTSHSSGSEVLRQDLYVDDVLTGADNIEALALKRDELIQILKWHGMELAKWNSNHASLTSNDDTEIVIKTSDNDITKTLGMSWKPQQDVFLYRFELPDITNPTKRSILSLVSKIYDLLGILSPIIIRCKILLQELWVQNIGWDDPLSDHLKALWFQIKDDLSFIHQVEVPRYVLTSPDRLGEIHGFADASQRAYGCCIYYRVSENGMYKSTLLIAKSKVAPIKAQSLPRLELCAAVLLSETCPVDRSLKPIDVVHVPPSELEDAFWKTVSLVQQSCYASDLQALEKGNVVQPSLQKLTPFLHKMEIGTKETNILRVGGRLANAEIPLDARFPALLPKDHRFVMFSKATHLELVSDLSANNFILCLKRFVGRRGIPQKIYCDNATNFVGAHNKLKELKESFFKDEVVQKMKSVCCQMGLEFNFIPPRAPHFGGLWEAAVKSTKSLLVKNVSQAHLTFEELQTLIVEIEAILNSRPIAPLSDDPNDGEALTPGHLLIGCSMVTVPEPALDVTKPSLLTRWQQISYLKQQFWKLWSRDYLLSLQQRSKWFKEEENVVEGQLVVVHEDNTPPQQWLLARITKCIPGRDGKIRVVELKTKNGCSCRPIHKISPLPQDD